MRQSLPAQRMQTLTQKPRFGFKARNNNRNVKSVHLPEFTRPFTRHLTTTLNLISYI